jgi:two-component system, LytTR family, response regulator LytT
MNSVPLRALVVEDEWPARNYLVELIEGSGIAEVVGAVANADEAKQALAPPSPLAVDVAFVDVNLAAGDREADRAGLTLVRSLSTTASAPAFVLATAVDRHALEAFELGVVDYLVKPFTEDRVLSCLRRVQARSKSASSPPAARIVARRKKSLVFLAPEEIWAFEASDRLTFVHTPHGRLDLDLSLAAIEGSFGRALVRVHRNWLVNAAHVKELERDGSDTHVFVGHGLADEGRGVRVPVARDRAQQVRDALLTNATGLRRS